MLSLDVEGHFLCAVIAQIEQPAAMATLQEVDPTAFSGHVSRVALATLQDLVCNRGIGLSRQEAVTRLTRTFSDNEDAVSWLNSMDFSAGARSNIDRLSRQVDRIHAAQAAEAILASAAVHPDSLDDDLSGILSRLSDVLSRTSDDRYRIDTLRPFLEQYAKGEAVIPAEQADSVLWWGVPDLDDPENGIIASRGTFGVIAAPPGFGKSIAVSQLAVQSASNAQRHVLVVSLEQSRQQVAMRSIASLRRDFKTSVKRGHHSGRFVPDMDYDAASRVHIMAPGSGTAWYRVEAAARRLHRQGCLDVLVLDYFTLLEPPNIGKQFNTAAMYGWISKAAKRLAQELNIAVVFVSQFNRGQGTTDQEPEPKDLKETGQLEQDADWLFFLWAPKKSDNLSPVLDEKNRVACYKKAKNRWGMQDFSGNPRYLEVDPARDLLYAYVRSTDGSSTAAEPGGFRV